MAETAWQSPELQLAKCVVDGIAGQRWQGNLQTLESEPATMENAVPAFTTRYIRDNESYKKELTVLVSLSSEVLDVDSQRCLEERYELFICIGRRFKGCEELDELLWLKAQIKRWICKHCCDGFEFLSFSDERLITYDADLMTNDIFETFIPVEYRLIPSNQSTISEGLS